MLLDRATVTSLRDARSRKYQQSARQRSKENLTSLLFRGGSVGGHVSRVSAEAEG